ncbi:MAG TPA: hypothetical protein VNV66_22440 [Pilimelia sp.]|nr:hypothetical protein [Pilimelia sp.]
MSDETQGILVGGPHDGEVASAGSAPLLELTGDGLIHRYIRTTQVREYQGTDLPVYNFDGSVAPDGGQSGVESAPERASTPMAASQARQEPPD